MNGAARDQKLLEASTRVGLNVGFLFLARILGMAMALVQAGIVFRALSLEGQGQFGAALGFASAFTVPATFGIQRLLVRDIARDRAIGWDYVWTGVVATGFLSTLSLGAIWLLQSGSNLQSAAFWAGFWVVFLWALQQPFESLLMAHERLGLVAVMNVFVGACKLTAVYVLLDFPVDAPDLDGVVYPTTAARAHAVIALANSVGLFLCIGLAIHVGGWQRPHLRPRAALGQIRECLPFAVAMLCSWVYFKSDIVLLEAFRGEREAGVYAPPQRLMEPLLMVAGLWGTAVFSHALPAVPYRCGPLRPIESHVYPAGVVAVLPMAMGVAVLARPVMVLLTGGDAALEESTFVLQLLALVVPFFYFNGICQEFLYSMHRNWYTTCTFASAAAVSLGLNLLLIPRYGVLGLCGVAIAANTVASVGFWYGLREELAAARLAGLIVRSLFACTLMGGLAWYVAQWSLLGAVVAGGLAYLALHGAMGTLNQTERQMLRHALAAITRSVRSA